MFENVISKVFPLPRPDLSFIQREQTPQRFLDIFSRVTGMRSINDLQGGVELDMPSIAIEAGVVGAIIYGSSTYPDSKPKDLDAFFIFSDLANMHIKEYLQKLIDDFNIAYQASRGLLQISRLDTQVPLDSGLKALSGRPLKVLKKTAAPIIYGYNYTDISKLSIALQEKLKR